MIIPILLTLALHGALDKAPHVLELEAARSKAIRDHDAATLRDLYADDFLGVIGTGGKVHKTEVLEAFAKLTNALVFSTTDVDVHEAGDVAIVSALLVGKAGDKVVYQMRFMHVWEKRGGRWQLVRGESTDVRD